MCSIRFFARRNAVSVTSDMHEARQLMVNSLRSVSDYVKKNELGIDKAIDPYRTGLIGPELTPLTTTIGHVEAKRTSCNPQMSALIVHLLGKAGVKSGDTIAVGASGSFPGLLLATLSAAKAMNVTPVALISLGSSGYGATRPEFDLLDIYNYFESIDLVNQAPLLISLGGDFDIGRDFDINTRQRLILKFEDSGLNFIIEADLQKNIYSRLDLLKNKKISAFINCGGSYVNLGTDNSILNLKPGLTFDVEQPPQVRQGMVQAMSATGVPIVHLLFLRGLVLRYGLQWDANPWLENSIDAELIDMDLSKKSIKIIAIIYFFVLSLGFIISYRSGIFKRLI
ncbi:poly-gamma-glutamate system protein [bacterium]|nr:poly-gamma-glutamate system protein [bacterium]